MGTVAAERRLVLKLPSGAEQAVVVRVFVPQPDTEGNWQCQYEIKGGRANRSFFAVGIDSVQALALALESVRVDLDYEERRRNARFWFLDEPGHEFK